MSCAACSARVEKAVNKVPGVTSCSVSLLTNSMGVEGTASASAIVSAVEEAGYGCSLKGASGQTESVSDAEKALEDHETPLLRKRLIASVGFLLVLMYFSMGHMMWGWPLPAWFDGNHIAMGLVQLLLAGIVMVINQKFFISGFRSLWHRSPNMDTLVALGSMASFVWSVYALFAMTRAQVDGNSELVMHYMMEFYFESAAMILTLITVGKMLEARSPPAMIVLDTRFFSKPILRKKSMASLRFATMETMSFAANSKSPFGMMTSSLFLAIVQTRISLQCRVAWNLESFRPHKGELLPILK